MLRRTKRVGVRRRSARKKGPPPEGFSLAQLAEQAGVTARAVRYYVERGVLPAAEFHGSRTRYGREHVMRLFAVLAMRKERLDLDAIRRRMSTLTPAALEAYLPPPPPAPAEGRALAPPPAPTYATTRWDQVTLLPGVELLVRADASPAVRKVVQEIVDHCVGSGGDG